MTGEVGWIVDVSVDPGAAEAFRLLADEMIAAARAEPGCLAYERYLSADGSRCCVTERYADAGAALSHLRAFGVRFAGRYEPMVRRRGFRVFGAADPALLGALSRFHPEVLPHVVGFVGPRR